MKYIVMFDVDILDALEFIEHIVKKDDDKGDKHVFHKMKEIRDNVRKLVLC